MLEEERVRKQYYSIKVTVETLAWIKKKRDSVQERMTRRMTG